MALKGFGRGIWSREIGEHGHWITRVCALHGRFSTAEEREESSANE